MYTGAAAAQPLARVAAAHNIISQSGKKAKQTTIG